jgi:TadE-like protein
VTGPPVTGCGSTAGESSRGSVIAEFALLGGLVVFTILAVVQLALFLYQRNVVVTSVAEGARVGATFGRQPEDGSAAACELIRQAIGERCESLRVTADSRDGLVVVAVDGTLPPIAPGLPALGIRHVATMHDEERLYPDVRLGTSNREHRGAASMAAHPMAVMAGFE